MCWRPPHGGCVRTGSGNAKGAAGRDGRRPLDAERVSARSGRLGRHVVLTVTAFGRGVFASALSVVGPAGLIGAVLAVTAFGTDVFVFAGSVVVGPAGGVRVVLARDRLGRSVAGVGNAIGHGLLNDRQVVADAGQERQVPARVRARAGTVTIGP